MSGAGTCTALPYREVEVRQHAEVQFIDRMLVSWSRWVRSDLARLTVRSVALYASPVESSARRDLDCDDDQFTSLDRQVARLPVVLGKVIFTEYMRYGSSATKAGMCRMNRHTYRQTLQASQWVLYSGLLPDVESWRQSVL